MGHVQVNKTMEYVVEETLLDIDSGEPTGVKLRVVRSDKDAPRVMVTIDRPEDSKADVSYFSLAEFETVADMFGLVRALYTTVE